MPALQLAADASAIAPIPAAACALGAFLALMFVAFRPDQADQADQVGQADEGKASAPEPGAGADRGERRDAPAA